MSNKKTSVALSSVFASAFLTIIKLIVGILTGSLGIISEAAHSALDFGAALLTFFAVKIGDKPADKEHPYGHGKVESVSALIETGLLFLTGFWIIYEAGKRLIIGDSEVTFTWYAIVIVIISIITDISRSRALKKTAKETNSQALEADALHFSSDIWSSSAVLFGLICVYFGYTKADAIAAIVVAIFVFFAGWRLGKRTIDVLIDSAPEGLTEKIYETVKQVDGVINIERLRARPIGACVFVDMIISVSRKLPLNRVSEITKNVEKEVKKLVPEIDLTVHTKPQALDNETIIDQVHMIAMENYAIIHDLVIHSNGKNNTISLDLEVEAEIPLKSAHKQADRLEEIIKNNLDSEVEINIHLDPRRANVVNTEEITAVEHNNIKEKIETLAKEIPKIISCKDFKIKKTQGYYFITFKCFFSGDLPIFEIHNLTSRLKNLIKEKIENSDKVLIHAEPV